MAQPPVPRRRQLLFALYMSGIMSLLMSGVITLINTGIGSGFSGRWMASWIVAWVVAFPLVVFIAPLAGRMTDASLKFLDRTLQRRPGGGTE